MSSASSYINHYEEWKEAKDSKKGNIPISWTIKNMHLSTSGMTTNNVDYVEKMLNGINELINSGAVTLEDAIVILTEYAKTKEISNDRIAKKRMRVLIDELKTRTKT